MAYANRHMGRPGGVNDSLRVCHGQGDRLFDQHVYARPDAVQGNGGVLAALSCDSDKIRPFRSQHLPVVCIDGAVQLVLIPLGVFGDDVAQPNGVQAVANSRGHVVFCDPAAAD